MEFGYSSSGYYHFPILIHSTPQIVLLAIDLHEDLIDVERIAVTTVSLLESMVEPNRVTNDVGREPVTLISIHQRIIDEQRLTCQYG
jgi:hypothetical protein